MSILDITGAAARRPPPLRVECPFTWVGTAVLCSTGLAAMSPAPGVANVEAGGNTVCTKGVVPGEGTLLSNAGKDSSCWPLTCPVTLLHGSFTAVTLSESLCPSLFPSDSLALSLHITPGWGCWSSAVQSSDRWSADTCSWVSADIAGTWTVRKCPPDWLVDSSHTSFSIISLVIWISRKADIMLSWTHVICLTQLVSNFFCCFAILSTEDPTRALILPPKWYTTLFNWSMASAHSLTTCWHVSLTCMFSYLMRLISFMSKLTSISCISTDGNRFTLSHTKWGKSSASHSWNHLMISHIVLFFMSSPFRFCNLSEVVHEWLSLS